MSAATRKPSRFRFIGKTRLIILTALAALLALCFTYSWLTTNAAVELTHLLHPKQTVSKQQASNKNQKPAKNKPIIINTQPWQTAQDRAAGVASPQEANYARQAEQLADHEVDQAFDAALRCAELRASQLNLTHQQHLTYEQLCQEFKMGSIGKTDLAGKLTRRVQQLQRDVAQDNSIVKHLKASAPATTDPADPAADSNAGGNSLPFAEFQLSVDNDELRDAQHDLDNATGNVSNSIANQYRSYQDSTRKFDSDEISNTPLPLHRVSNPGTFIGRLDIWFRQNRRIHDLKKARNETCQHLHRLDPAYTNCSKQDTKGAAPAPAPAPASTSPAGFSQSPDNNTLNRMVFIHSDRIRTNYQLAGVYANWIHQVQFQHSVVQGQVLKSIEAILAVILWIFLCEAILHGLTDHPRFARKKMQTLRAVFRVGIQLIGVLIILLLIFGPPHETGTIIGLITAALALALQDYILAFFGWFMLAGPNGISVGDMVEIDGVCGEVVDIGLMRTTLLETTGLQEKGEPTGRRVSLLNSFAVHGTCFNFSTEGQWLWDEITITVPADSDIYTIAKSVEEVAIKETAESARRAEQDWNQKMPSTSLNRISAAPIVMMRPSISLDVSTSIDIQIRYVTHAVGRYEVRDRLYKHVIQMLKEQDHIDPSQQTNPAPA